MNRIYSLTFFCAVVVLTGCSGSAKKEAGEPSYFKVDPATAGVLTGKIHFTGKKPAGKTIDMDQDPECAKAHGNKPVVDEPVVAGSGGALANVFVYIKSGLEGKTFEAPSTPVTIDQKGCQFHPRVVGIQTNQPFDVTNSDPVTHNIHPVAEVNREWNHSQAPGDPPLARKFVRPEIMIRVKCNVHNWMRAWVGVVDHPYFAVTGEDGSFEIRNVPPGKYTIAAWQEVLGTQEQPVTVAPSGTTDTAFTFRGE